MPEHFLVLRVNRKELLDVRQVFQFQSRTFSGCSEDLTRLSGEVYVRRRKRLFRLTYNWEFDAFDGTGEMWFHVFVECADSGVLEWLIGPKGPLDGVWGYLCEE